MNASGLAACALVLVWLALVWITWCRPVRQRRAERGRQTDAAQADRIAVIYASQSGTAAELAQRTAHVLGARARPLSDFTPQTLGDLHTALFVVSTSGEGDAPDAAHAFDARARAWPHEQQLSRLRFGLLALGDRSYAQFCGYGRRLDRWLRQHGATALFDAVWVDRLNQTALHQWQTLLAEHWQASDWQAPEFTTWRLAQRRWINPGSQGASCHELLLHVEEAKPPRWQAGDVAQVLIGDSGQQRDYSVASTPSEGLIRLLVRSQCHPDGAPGLGGHWLSASLPLGGNVQLHIRSNAQFHCVEEDRPAIFIGNGTGLAGLRALIQERRERGQQPNWLIFGERQRQHDFFWQDDLQAWLADGTLQRLDLAFSRDQAQKRYVQHCLREAADAVRTWIARGAVVYVCGSRNGMAQDVDLALQDILGAHGYQDLFARSGYRRDVY